MKYLLGCCLYYFFAWVGSVSDSCPMTTPITIYIVVSQIAGTCRQEHVSLLYHYWRRWTRAFAVYFINHDDLLAGIGDFDPHLYTPGHSFMALWSPSRCVLISEDQKCLDVPYLHCFCSDLLYSFNVLVSLIIVIFKLLAVLSMLNNGDLFIESASVNTQLARKAAYFRSLSCTTAFLKYLWYHVNFHIHLVRYFNREAL